MRILSCFVDLIGLRGACSNTAPYYLDSIGISLKKAAELADSASITGKELFEESRALAWEVLKNDITFDGFKANKVSESINTKLIDVEEISTDTTYTYHIKRRCDIESIKIESIKVKCLSSATVSVSIISGDTYNYYNDVINNEQLEVIINEKFDDDVTVQITYFTNTPIQVGTDSGGVAAAIKGIVACDIEVFICQYFSVWALALMYKTAALMLNRVLLNDRYNNLIAYGTKEASILMAQFDSSFNQFPQEMQINKDGMYQSQLKIIDSKLKDIIKKSDCGCCFECSEKNITETIQIP